MKLTYNNLELTKLGEVVLSTTTDYEGQQPDAAQRKRVQLKVTLHLFEEDFSDHMLRYEQLRTALAKQHATLVWEDDAGERELLSTAASVQAHDVPDNETGWFEMLTVTITFLYFENLSAAETGHLSATFTSNGKSTNLGSIAGWREGYTQERFSPVKSHRARTGGSIEATGMIYAPNTQTQAQKQQFLLGSKTALNNALLVKEGTLVFGDFSQVVRVSDFRCDIDQPNNAVRWTLSATFTRFPNEADYATVEYNVEERDGQNGELLLSFNGTITAPDLAKAKLKLGVVKASVLAAYGYTAGQLLREDAAERKVEANTDGSAFLQLGFQIEARRWRSDNMAGTLDGESLGQVNRWVEKYSADRPSPLRDQRTRAGSIVTASGTLPGNLSQDVAERRAFLLARKEALLAAANRKRGTLVYGSFSQVVRVEDFTAEVNQAVNGVEWSLTCSFTRFPNESNYATADFTATTRDAQNGELILTFAGKIQSHSLAGAQAKLDSLRTTVLSTHGYTASQTLRAEQVPSTLSANADGDVFLELGFVEEYRKWRSDNQPATLGGQSLGQIQRWADRVNVERYHPHRSHRRQATCSITASGTLAADRVQETSAARAALLAAARGLKEQAQRKEVTLVFGDFTRTVRVDDFTADWNQAVNGVEWSLSAHYVLAPDEADYALVEFSTEERDPQNGELLLSFTGRIQAHSESAARAKLAALRTSVLTVRGYLNAPALRRDSAPSEVDAGGDGRTFTELSFAEEYRHWRSDNLSATFTPTAGLARSLGNISRWSEGYAAERPSPFRSQRSRAEGRVQAQGTLRPTAVIADLATRRTELLRLKDELMAAVNQSEGTLVYGQWNKIVRVVEFTAQVDQAIEGIDWSITCSFTRFPNEADYASAEFSSDVVDAQDGELGLTLTGRVLATNVEKARARLASVRGYALASRGFANGQLLRQSSNESRVYANGDKTSTVSGEGEDGTTFIELSFTEEYRAWRSDNQQATFNGRSLGHVRRWEQRYNARRFSDLRKQREHAAGQVTASGTFTAGSPSDSVATRRAALVALANAMQAEVNRAEGSLIYGSAFSQTVRVEEFTAQVNQAITGIDWTLTASYSLFPNEAGYSLVDFEVAQREAPEEGEQFLSLSGKIGAQNETVARTNLATLRASVLAAYGFAAPQQTRKESNARSVEADSDGSTFIELSFSEEYRKRNTSGIAYTLRVNDRADGRTGIVVTTYSGTVTAGGATDTDAYAAALAKAEALGAGKYPFLLASTIGFDTRQIRTTAGTEFVRLEFTYEYQRRDATLKALEVNVERMVDTFGVDSIAASGSVAAVDYSTARAFFNAEVLPLFSGLVIRNIRLSEAYEVQDRSGTKTTFWTRLDFTVSAPVPKSEGSVAVKYALEVEKNYAALSQRVTLTGSVFASTRAAAETFLDGLIGTLQLGTATSSRRSEDMEYRGTNSQTFLKLDFTESFTPRLTGITQLVECSLTEDVTYSATRWVEQPVPTGASVMQNCGTLPGRRSVRATATASTVAVAEAWCNTTGRALLTGDASSGSYPEAEQRTIDYQFVPLVDGVVSGAGANFQASRVTKVFGEILPNYPAPA